MRPLVVADRQAGVPDGLAVDAEGMLWVAFWGGGRIDRLAPDGRLVERITVDAPQVTSCCPGGPDGRTLYITTARRGMDAAQLRRHPNAGRVFAAPIDVPGPPTRPFRGVLSVADPDTG